MSLQSHAGRISWQNYNSKKVRAYIHRNPIYTSQDYRSNLSVYQEMNG